MAQPIFANNVAGLLAANIGPSDTAVLLGAGQGALFPAIAAGNWAYATIVNQTTGAMEHVKITAKSVDTLTVVRGQDGTGAQSFTTGAIVEMRAIAQMFREVDWHAAAGAVNGLATLDGTSTIPVAQIPAAIARVADISANYVPLSQKGANNGVASLDGAGDVPDGQIPAGIARVTDMVATYIPLAQKAAANGVASLDGSTKIPVAQIPALGYLPLTGGALSGSLTVNTNVEGTNHLVLACQAGSVLFLRPNGGGSSAGQGLLSGTGLLQVVDLQIYSDKRRKKKIQKRFARQGLAHKLQLSSWINRADNTPGIGLIAQNVLPHAPEYVGEDLDGYYSVNYAGIALEIGFDHETRMRRIEAALHLGSPE